MRTNHITRAELARALARVPESPMFAKAADKADVAFTSSGGEVMRMRCAQPKSGLARVELSGMVANFTNDSQLVWNCSPGVPDAATGNGSMGFSVFVDHWTMNATIAVELLGVPTGGTFTLTYNGQTTAAIPYNATVAQVQSALTALSLIGASGARVTGATGGAWVIAFLGIALDSAGRARTLTATSSLTGGTAPSVGIEGVRNSPRLSLTGQRTVQGVIAFSGGRPGQLWDIIWRLSANTGAGGSMSFNAAAGRIASMLYQPL